MIRGIFGALLSSCACVVFAEEAPPIPVDNYFFRADYFSVPMPNQQDALGLVGLHLDKKFDSGFYTGLGLYSAVSGQYSGFFALGGELGWQHLIYRYWGMDTGIFVGTGGGKNTGQQIGNGSFVSPHAGLYYQFPQFNLGVDYSNIRFNGGRVNSHQWVFHLDWPFQLFKTASSPLIEFDQNNSFDESKNYIAAVGSFYHPHHSQFTDGQSLTNNTELLGIELGHFLTQHVYNYFEFTGAVHGNTNGYANLFAGLGWQQALGSTSFFITPRFALGSGGGGAYDVGSGLLVYPSLGLGWQFATHWQVEVLSGYLSSVDGHYHAMTGELQLKHDFDLAVPGKSYSGLSVFDAEPWRIRMGNQLYIKPAHDNGQPDDNINLFSVKADRFLTPHWYLTGQTAFAYTGHAAGYFSGMLGAGYQTNAFHRLSLFSEATLGTAGGAGLDIHDGALAQLGLGANYQWTPALGVYSEISKLTALKGNFHPTTVDVGMSYSFGLLKSDS